jgi:DNA ligase-associated metallophosphoesterase
MQIEFNNIRMELLADRAVFIEDKAMLVISDLHLGKASHFRKSGISIPMQSLEKDYMRLNMLIERKQPQSIVIIGDLFHSSHNNEWKVFCDFVADNAKMQFILVKGNHDILEKKYYKEACMEVFEKTFEKDELIFSHEPLNEVPAGKLNMSGHVHPGYLLQGKGKQTIQLPCFFKRGNQLILPAFGNLTGLQMLEKTKGTEIFVIANDKVIAV